MLILNLLTRIASLVISIRDLHITPTKRVYQEVGLEKRKYRQSRCKLCGLKTIYVCNFCVLKPEHGDKGAAFCNSPTGRTRYATHMRQEHKPPFDFIFIIVFFTFVSLAMFVLLLSIVLKSSPSKSIHLSKCLPLKRQKFKKTSFFAPGG
jgi:hypothetical protein